MKFYYASGRRKTRMFFKIHNNYYKGFPCGASGKEPVNSVQFSSIQFFSHVRLFATPWITARQASLSITNSWSSLRLTCQLRRHKRHGFDPWVRKNPWRRKWQPTPIFLPGESHGERNLAGFSPCCCRVRHDWSDLAHTDSSLIVSWIFIGRTDAEAEAPILWPSDMMSWLVGKGLDARKDWGQKEKGMAEDEMVR